MSACVALESSDRAAEWADVSGHPPETIKSKQKNESDIGLGWPAAKVSDGVFTSAVIVVARIVSSLARLQVLPLSCESRSRACSRVSRGMPVARSNGKPHAGAHVKIGWVEARASVEEGWIEA